MSHQSTFLRESCPSFRKSSIPVFCCLQFGAHGCLGTVQFWDAPGASNGLGCFWNAGVGFLIIAGAFAYDCNPHVHRAGLFWKGSKIRKINVYHGRLFNIHGRLKDYLDTARRWQVNLKEWGGLALQIWFKRKSKGNWTGFYCSWWTGHPFFFNRRSFQSTSWPSARLVFVSFRPSF